MNTAAAYTSNHNTKLEVATYVHTQLQSASKSSVDDWTSWQVSIPLLIILTNMIPQHGDKGTVKSFLPSHHTEGYSQWCLVSYIVNVLHEMGKQISTMIRQ